MTSRRHAQFGNVESSKEIQVSKDNKQWKKQFAYCFSSQFDSCDCPLVSSPEVRSVPEAAKVVTSELCSRRPVRRAVESLQSVRVTLSNGKTECGRAGAGDCAG